MEKEYIKQTLQLIEEKLQWGDPKKWTNGDYVHLSKVIYDKTKVSISHATLKRLFGKQKTYREDLYNPQIETKNALALFVGYKDWIDLKEQIDLRGIVKDYDKRVGRNNADKKEKIKKIRRKTLIVIVLFILAGSVYLIYDYNQKNVNKKKVLNKIKFSLEEKEGEAPLNVVVNYDVSKTQRDIILDFGDYENRRYPSESVILSKNENKLVHCYASPGYYTMTLKTGRTKLLERKIFVTTNGWYSFVTYKVKAEKSYKVKDIKYFKDTANSRLYASPDNVHIDPLFEVDGYWVEFNNTRHYDIIADQMVFKTKVKNPTDEGGFFCNDIIIYIYCEHGDIRLNYIGKGCSRWLQLQVGDVTVNGVNNDLNEFSTDLSVWHEVGVEIINSEASFFIDEKRIADSLTYNKPLGEVLGIHYVFKGCGSVDYVELKDLQRNRVYSNDF